MIQRKSIALAVTLGALTAAPALAQVAIDGFWVWNSNGQSGAVQTIAQIRDDQQNVPDATNIPLSPNSSGVDTPGSRTRTTIDIWDAYTRNQIQNPDLNPAYAALPNPDPRPNSTSPVLGSNGAAVVDMSKIDPFFDVANYAGGLDGGPSWIDGWTWSGCTPADQAARTDLPPSDFAGGDFKTDVPAGPVGGGAANVTWNLAGSPYLLNGKVQVDAGQTLTIDAGVVVFGSGIGTFLAVERDGFLNVNGTASDPVIFTVPGWEIGDQLPGDWGGVVLHGKAVANCAGGGAVPGCNLTTTGNDCVSEGNAGNFGGSDNADGSAFIRYARVEFSGQEINLNNELNSWTFNAQGTGTDAQFLQAHLGTDDLFEWFGGVMESKYWYGSAGQDDGFDWQMGFQGRFQHGVLIQGCGQDGDKMIEADNNEFDLDCPGRSNPIVGNLTGIGATGGTHGVDLRVGTNGQVYNTVLVDWPSHAVRVRSDESYQNGIVLPQATPAPAITSFAVNVSPNPIRSSTVFSFNLPTPAGVELKVFDSRGRLVDTVSNRQMDAGRNTVSWTPRDNSVGVYYYQLSAGVNSAKGKLLILSY